MSPQWRDEPAPHQRPRIIIHGGAGSITRTSLPPALWHAHRASLQRILRTTHALLQDPKTDALAAATHAVQQLERDAQFNAARGAVFTRAGTIELEASVMVSRGQRKRGAAVSLLRHVKSPVGLAAAMLRRGEADDGGGAQRHEQLSGRAAEALAADWGLELCDESFFWTKKRWDEHRRGLQRGEKEAAECRPDGSAWPADEPAWDGREYLPQGTVGCVAMDRTGTLAVATSTGGLTNKLPGRIGDTPTFGAGFWAEEWVRPFPWALEEWASLASPSPWSLAPSPLASMARSLAACLPTLLPAAADDSSTEDTALPHNRVQAVAMSGTGNGDSFLRIAAVRTAAAKARFGHTSLAHAVSWMAGRRGELQRSAGAAWGKQFEGEGGIIGIENLDGRTSVVFDFNCGGMFRAWVDDDGEERCMVFHDEY